MESNKKRTMKEQVKGKESRIEYIKSRGKQISWSTIGKKKIDVEENLWNAKILYIVPQTAKQISLKQEV